jgi:hypothetical protein
MYACRMPGHGGACLDVCACVSAGLLCKVANNSIYIWVRMCAQGSTVHLCVSGSVSMHMAACVRHVCECVRDDTQLFCGAYQCPWEGPHVHVGSM